MSKVAPIVRGCRTIFVRFCCDSESRDNQLLMNPALRRWNLSPVMAIGVAIVFLSLWADTRARIAGTIRLPADIAVGAALVLLVVQGVRGPRIEYGSLHPSIRPWFVVVLVAGLVTLVFLLAAG